MRKRIFLLTIVFIVLACPYVGAETNQIQLVLNELRILSVNNLNRVAVGDPAIVDISVLSDEELMLIAKGAGTTGLIIWDDSGQRSFQVSVIAKDLQKSAHRIRELLLSSQIRSVYVKTDEDKIYILGEADTEDELERIKDILSPFSNIVNLVRVKQEQQLVEMDVNVLEISVDDLKRLGLDWTDSLPLQYSEPSGSAVDGKLTKFWKVLRWDRTTLDAHLNFLIEEEKARILANPKLITLSGKEASFLVGGEVPYVVVEDGDRTAVQWKNYGVNLRINPVVNKKGQINTKIKAEVSELDWVNAVTQDGYNIPAFTKREAQTELFLNAQDTVFLAGLLKHEDSQNVDRLPWLSRVPILGELFKSKQFQDKRTELVISITPRLVQTQAQKEDFTEQMGIREEDISSADRQFSFPEYSEETSVLAAYSQMIEDLIARSAVYPAAANKEGTHRGTVKVGLRIAQNGQLKEAEIIESSGYSVLDAAAFNAVNQAAPYPAFPREIKEEELQLIVPVVFK